MLFAMKICYKTIRQLYTTTRLFWIVVIGISCWNMTVICILMLKRYLSDSISISVETSFLHWNITFPSVSICLSKSRSNAEIMRFLNQTNINYIKNIHNYLFITPTNINTKEDYCKGFNSTCGVNIHITREQLLTQFCESIITDIKFLEVEQQSCKKIFKFHDLEMGYCFLANNIMDYHNLNELPLRLSPFEARKSIKLFLKQEALWKYEIYVHSNVDIPYFGLLSQTLGQDHIRYTYNMEEMINSVTVNDQSFEKRKCKFPHETIYGSSYHYSFSSCMSDLRILLELKHCNCTLFTSPIKSILNIYGKLNKYYYDVLKHSLTFELEFYPTKGLSIRRYPSKLFEKLVKPLYENKIVKPHQKIYKFVSNYFCDFRGMTCISREDITFKAKRIAREKYVCYPSCSEQKLQFVGSTEIKQLARPNLVLVDIEIQNVPSLRFVRSVTQSYQDLVVSAGGVIGLFIGISLLSVIDFIYLCLKKL